MTTKLTTRGHIAYTKELHGKHKSSWTNKELNYLIEYYYEVGPKEVSLALERTERAVREMAAKMRKDGRLIMPEDRKHHPKL